VTTSQPAVPPVPAMRRAPFADNPSVGVRGVETHRRILQAALDVFGQVGYHGARVEAITAAAGCSRPSFYQYFSSKEDLFRQLAGHVARALYEITERIEIITREAAGLEALRGWLEDYSDIYDDYTAVFNAYGAARGSDDAIASGAGRVARRQVSALAARVDSEAATAPIEDLTPLLFHLVVRTNRYRHLLGQLDGEVPLDRARINDALAVVLHRAVFGARPRVNMTGSHPDGVPRRKRTGSPRVPAGVGSTRTAPGAAGRATRDRLMAVGRQVFAKRGYHDTRVHDIVELAATSHGTFYRYFRDKQDLFRVIAAEAGRRIFAAIDALPDIATGDALREWATAYTTTYRDEGPIIRVWVEAMTPDNELGTFSINAVDGVRRRLARFLAPRGFGDVDAESLVLLALIDGAPWERPSGGPPGDVLADVVARSFLGVTRR